MTRRSVSTTRRADDDIASALEFYLGEGRHSTAARFLDELEKAFTKVADHPAIGSSRHATEAGIPAARSIALQHFPYVAFYLESGDRIRVIRVLHTRREVLAELGPDT